MPGQCAFNCGQHGPSAARRRHIERAQPAPPAALVLAPLFVYTEVLMALGLTPKLHALVEPRVSKALADFRAKP